MINFYSRTETKLLVLTHSLTPILDMFVKLLRLICGNVGIAGYQILMEAMNQVNSDQFKPGGLDDDDLGVIRDNPSVRGVGLTLSIMKK